MLLAINPFQAYFTGDSVDFYINGVHFCGDVVDHKNRISFYLDETCSDPAAAELYAQLWELISDEIEYIYFNRPAQPFIDAESMSETVDEYKGFSIVFKVEHITPPCFCSFLNNGEKLYYNYFAGFDILTPRGESLGGLVDTINEATQLIDEYLNYNTCNA